jgi:hypothetical protein
MGSVALTRARKRETRCEDENWIATALVPTPYSSSKHLAAGGTPAFSNLCWGTFVLGWSRCLVAESAF